MKLIRSNRTETITRSEALKLFEGVASGNYVRIVKKYVQFLIEEDLEVSTMSRNIFLQSVSEASARTYKSAVNRFLEVCDQYQVLKIREDAQLKRIDHSLTGYVLLFLSEADIRQSSKETYKKALQEFVKYLEDNGLPVSKKTVQDWKEGLRQRLSAFTVNVYLSAVRQFAKYIIDQADVIFKEDAGLYLKELNRITSIKNLKIEKDFHKDSFTPAEMKQLTKVKDQEVRLMIALMYYGGLRTVEVTRLKVEDVKLKEGVLMVLGKGKDQRQPVPVNDRLKVMLSDYLGSRKKGQLFEGLTTAQIRMSVNRVLEGLNLKQGERKRSCHSFRHSYVQHLIEAGVDLYLVQQLARHQSINTTEVYFRKLQQDQKLKGITNVLV